MNTLEKGKQMRGCSFWDDMLAIVSENDGGTMGAISSQSPGQNRLPFDKAVENYPTVKEIVAFCTENNMDCIIKALVLVIKREWEIFILSLNGKPCGCHADVDQQAPKPPFKPDTKIIYSAFEEQGHMATRAGYSQKHFSALIREIVLVELYEKSISSPEVRAFVQRVDREKQFFLDDTQNDEHLFWEAKLKWLWLQEELGDKLLLVESRRLKNAHIRQEWMKNFGDIAVELETHTFRLEILQLKLELLGNDSSLSAEDLDKLAQSIVSEMQKKLDAMQLELTMAYVCQQQTCGKEISAAQLNDHLRECKKLLRQIWMLIHPDRMVHHPAYDALTESQQYRLKELWHQALRIRPEELGFDETQIGYAYRSNLILVDILKKAKAILKHAGIDTDTDFIIEGDTIEAQLEWLQWSNGKLQADIDNATASLKVLLEDPTTLEMAEILRCSMEDQHKFRAEMKYKTEATKQEADKLEAKLHELAPTKGDN